MRKTLKQKLSEMRKLCKQCARCKDFRKETSLEKAIYRLHLSIVRQVTFEGVKWSFDSWTEDKWRSDKRDRWKMQISASILSQRGDMKILAAAYRLGSEFSGSDMTIWMDDSIKIWMNPAIVIVNFSDRATALRFLKKHKILIDMKDYVSGIRQRIASLEADIVEKTKFVIRMNKEITR